LAFLLGFRELLRIHPKLADGHTEIVAYRSHYVATRVGTATLDSAEVIRTVSECFGQIDLGDPFSRPHFRYGAAKNLMRRLGFSLYVGSDRLGHQAILEDPDDLN